MIAAARPPRARRAKAILAGTSLLVVTLVALAGLSASGSAATVNFASGSLIIPMDTDTAPASGPNAAHAAYNQNLGMWKAYGLVYKLLQNDIPVKWAIKEPNKAATTDIDVSVTSVTDKRTSTALGSWDYRGGPFIVDSAYAAAALPIITAWWAANGNQPNVHQAGAGFSAGVRLTLNRAPRIANEAINASITMAYYNTAGIPDSNGNAWSTASPNVLDGAEIANGALFTPGTCLQRAYDIFVTPHNSGYAYSLTDPSNLGTRTYSQLDTFVEQGGGWTALCHSILSNENNINNLTRNGSPAVKAMFRTSQPGGVPGGFLTTNGFPTISNGGGTWKVDPNRAGLPVAQIVPTTAPQAMPGGSVQTWPSPGFAGAPTYWTDTERLAFFDNPGLATDYDHVIAGTYHNATGAGKVTYIGGHSFSTALPYSGNSEGPYLRMFYNSIFFNGAAVAKIDLELSPSTYPQNGTGVLSASIVNTGGTTATDLEDVVITLRTGFTYNGTTSGPPPLTVQPNVDGTTTITWANVFGDIAAGATAATIEVFVDSSISGTLGSKNFGQLYAVYGDEYGEGFKANVCRDITVSPTPAPSLTKTPSLQGPVATGSNVTWTLNYGNTGGAALQSSVLQDTLPPGFSYISSSPAASTVIPAPSGTIVRWNLGTLAPGASGSRTITARAGAITSGTGTPPQQVFTNSATLTGTDSIGTPLSIGASADVTVQALDITLGKIVDNTFLASLPGSVTYTLSPRSSGSDQFTNVRVIDLFPTGLTAPPTAVGQGGTYGAYTPIAAVPGVDGNLATAMSVSSNVVTQGGSVTVTLNVKNNAIVNDVAPTGLSVGGGDATCTGPVPASGIVPNGGAGLDFVWSCTLTDLGEYSFSAGAEDAGATTTWPEASSASVLATATGGPSVVTWSLGSTTAAVPGETITSGSTAGIFGFRGANTTTFQRYGIAADSWTAKTGPTNGIEKGGSLTTDGVGTIWALEGNSKWFYRYLVATDTWTRLTDTSDNANEGGAVQLLNVGGTEYVYALLGNSNRFRRYSVAGNTWSNMANTPSSVKKGGALTTDGTYLYALRGDRQKSFWRCNATTTGSAGSCDTSWTAMASLAENVGWGGSLTRIGGHIYALRGDGQKNFYRYDIAGNTWSAMTGTPGNVADGGALTTDGTNIYAFQGKTTTYWRYNVASNTWSTLAAFTANTGQGGALVFVPGVNPQGRFTSLNASRSLVVTGDTVTVTFSLTSSTVVNNITAGTLTTTPTGGASCSSLTGPTLTSADDDATTGVSDPVTYQWTCTVAAGANPGTLTFGNSGATGSGPVAFPAATSNSVLVSPPLTFTATVPSVPAPPNPIVDQALLIASGQAASSPPVSTFVGSPTLTVVKSNAPDQNATLLPGDTITYSMVVENVGSGNATNVTVTDVVPTNTSYASCSGGTSCSQSLGTVTWNVGTLAPGATATVAFVVSTSTSLPISATKYTISNAAKASSTEKPTPVDSNTVTNHLQVLPEIVKSVDLLEAAPGDTLTYTLTVSNPGAAFTADVTDAVPAGTSFAGLGTCVPATCTLVGNTVTWSGVTIAPGTNTFSFDVQVTASGGDTVTNRGSLDPTVPDLAPIPSNPVETEIGPTVELVKLNFPTGPRAAGEPITYTLVVSNESDVVASDVVVTDTLPAALDFVSCDAGPAPATCGFAGGVVTWNLGNVGSDSVTVSFETTVKDPVPAGVTQIDNIAQVTAFNAPDPMDSNRVTNPVAGLGSLILVKTADPTTYDSVGDVIGYSYKLQNVGPVNLTAPYAVTDDKAAVTCPQTPTPLVPGAFITCAASYRVTQADIDFGSVTNLATGTATDSVAPNDPVTSNQAQATVPAVQDPKLGLSKVGVLDMTVVAPNTRVDVGDKVNYTLTATNTGNQTLTNVSIVDAKLGVLTCTQPVTLAPGATLVCTGSYTVVQGDIDAGKVGNTATADSDETPPTDTPNEVPLPKDPKLLLDKTAQEATFKFAGDVLHYSYEVTNSGNTSFAGPVTVTDDKATVTCPTLTTVGNNNSTFDPGEVITCTATYTVTPSDVTAGKVTNVATAKAGGVDSNEDAVTVDKLTALADLAVTKTSAPNPYTAGNELTYTVVVTNNGPSPVVGAAVTDTVPAALTAVTWTCSITSGSGACGSLNGSGNAIATTVDLTDGAAATYTIKGTVAGGTTEAITNSVTVTTPLGVLDPNPGNNVAMDSNNAQVVEADPTITITPGTSNVSPSAALDFIITVSNNGPSAATGVKAIVSIPPGYGFTSATGSGWTCALSVNLVICDLSGTLADSTSAPPISLKLTAPGTTGTTTVPTSVTSASTDTNLVNNDASATVNVSAPPIVIPPDPQADLALTKTASSPIVSTGDRFTYTLAVKNNGPDTADKVVVTDTLPAGVAFVSASGDGWTCTTAGNVVTCSRPSLASGASSSFPIVVTATTGGAALVNTGTVRASTKDPNTANNTASATVTVSRKADLVVTKTAATPSFVAGLKLTYTVTVANNGPDAVTGARVSDIVWAQLAGVSWTCSAVSGACGSTSGTGSINQLVDISFGGRVTFTISGTPKPGAPATLTNSASASVPPGVVDPDPGNNRASVTVKRGQTRLRATITPEVAIVTSGIPIPATVVTKNIGKQTAVNVITCVSLPPGITVAKASGGFAREGSYCWRTKTLRPGAKVTFKFLLRGDSSLAGRVRLVATARASNAPSVSDRSRLIVLSGTVKQGGFTG